MKRSCLLMKIIRNTSISQRQNPHTWTDQSSYKDIEIRNYYEKYSNTYEEAGKARAYCSI